MVNTLIKADSFMFIKKLVVVMIMIVGSFITLSAHAATEQERSTVRLKVLSESLKATDITEIRKLIKNGADVNVKNKYDATPLYMAAEEGHTQIVAALLKANANVNAARKSGATPLYMAAQNGHTQIVAALLKANANVNAATTDDGTTPLFVAALKGHTQIVAALLKAKADVNAKAYKNGKAYTPMSIAKIVGHKDIIKLLKKAIHDR